MGGRNRRGGKIGSAVTLKSGNWAVALQKRPLGKAAATKERAGLVLRYTDASRFSAISSIFVTEFQLRPVPGVFRIL